MIFAAAFFGVLFAASTPPTNFLAGIPLGLVGLAWVLRGSPRDLDAPAELALGPRSSSPGPKGALAGGVFGLTANLVALRFVPEVVVRFTSLSPALGWTALVLLAAAQALPWATCGAVVRLLQARAHTPFPLAFACGVYVATLVPSVFPWTPVGAISPWPVVLQSAELVGESGTSALLALAAGLVVEGAAHVRPRAKDGTATLAARLSTRDVVGPWIASALVVVALLAFGAVRIRAVARLREAAPHAGVALVQPGFDAGDRWDPARANDMLDRLTALTASAESRGASLTVWPESAYPYTLAHDARTFPEGDRAILRPEVRGPVLTGIYMVDEAGASYNAAAVATNDGRLSAPYDKRHLLWFGETVPLSDTFPWLRKVVARGPGLLPGHDSVLLRTDEIRAAVLNCYEDTLSGAGREAMEHAPNLLVNITNDAWFAGSAEGELHLRLSVLRAVETRRDLVRAVNRGPTAHVGADGRVLARYDGDLPAALPTNVALLDDGATIFTRFGHFPMASVMAASVVGAYARTRKRRPRPADEPPRT